MELGKKIRQFRQKAGWTQEQLAEKMGVAAQSVSKWENAAAMPDITALPWYYHKNPQLGWGSRQALAERS